MPKNEWLSDWSRKITEESGGSFSADGAGGAKVIHSRFGEFASKLGDWGELIVTFADQGITCRYDLDHKLTLVLVDAASFFGVRLRDFEETLGHESVEARNIVRLLKEKELSLFFFVLPTLNKIMLEMRSNKGLISEREIENVDFKKGFDGDIEVNEYGLAYHVVQQGDEMTIGVGERSGTTRTLIPFSVSNEVDYMSDMNSRSLKKYSRLADKILLNR